VLALESIPSLADRAPRAPGARLGRYSLLKRLQGGLRAEVWLAVPQGAEALSDVVLLKHYFPHEPGAALEALIEELTLAKKLNQGNIARTLDLGTQSERHFIVGEYLEGATLRALLRRATVAGVHIPPAAVARVLLALLGAVRHAQQQATSRAAQLLVNQLLPPEDVFITFEGDVKVLGFKTGLHELRSGAPGAGLGQGIEQAAVDALLAGHLSAELQSVLAAAKASPRARPCDGLGRFAQALKTWQTEERNGDGRPQLASLMSSLLSRERLEQRERLHAAFDEALRARRESGVMRIDVEDELAPVSGYRLIGSSPRDKEVEEG
jgi:serine/threonine protein kinase